MMASHGNKYVWILHLALMMVCCPAYGTDGRVNSILKQPNVTTSNFGFNSVNVSWEAEEITEKGKFTVCYMFSYKFLDKEKWLKLTMNYHIINLRMHPRLVGSVSNALCESNNIRFQSKATEFVHTVPQVYMDNVSCVLFNTTNLNCSWHFKTDAPDDANYSFALRLESKWLACSHYFKEQKKNVGCSMPDVFSNYKDHNPLYKIRIRFFSDTYNFSKTFRTEAIEILTPPRNIEVLSENGTTIIKWLPPPSIAINSLEDGMTSTYDTDEENNYFLYEIRVIEDKSKLIFRTDKTAVLAKRGGAGQSLYLQNGGDQVYKQTDDIEKEEQVFTDLVKDKKYYMQIRARHKRDFSKFWGEWSIPVFINTDNSTFPEWILIVILPALFAVPVFFLCQRYIKKLLVTPIPRPSQNIKNWLHMNGSNDIRMQANIATQNEQSVPLTEIKIVTTTGTRDCDEKP